MKAYKLYYSTGGKQDGIIVIVDEGQSLEEALSEKDSDFSVDSRFCRIDRKKEIPLSTVRLSELSIVEFLKLGTLNK